MKKLGCGAARFNIIFDQSNIIFLQAPGLSGAGWTRERTSSKRYLPRRLQDGVKPRSLYDAQTKTPLE
ncbi:hypothetical protein I9018_09000 [Pseudomonas sp. MPFS]|uniref:hypothetical protein n=1 Tax=Pseudomonas sp. MPFS TaxID=2795724 RepID=UPI001F12EE65|nr:hypothetical protein [Pseudomonas sp. MPFS]UMZ13816.1 hypothetical protein I9018_09000 [Pseudomonas sp. MPFS]